MATGIALVSVAGSSGVASADQASDGLWYYDLLHVQDAHDAGIIGKGVTVAVIDTPINLALPTLADADITVSDAAPCFHDGKPVATESEDLAATTSHGSNVASLIVGSGAGFDGQAGVRGVAPGVKLHYYVGGDTPYGPCEDASGKQIVDISAEIDQAVTDGANIISWSGGTSFQPDIVKAIARAERAGVVMVFAVSNQDTADDAVSWSESANGVIGVQSADRNANIATNTVLGGDPQPNLDAQTDVIAPGVDILLQGSDQSASWHDQQIGSGTSFATPIVAGFLADVWQKYPHATANQLIQTLIHNTGADDHPLTYDDSQASGYGFVSLTHMLRVDPTQYPDKNPLLTDDGEPSPAEILAAATDSPTPTDVSKPHTGVDSSPLVVVGVIGGLLVVGAVILVVVLARRRTRFKAGA